MSSSLTGFSNRHIGINQSDLSKMLNTIGVDSLDQLIDETLDIFKVNNGVFYPKVFEVKRTGFVTNLLSLSITNFYAFPFFNDQSELKGAVVLGFFTSNEVILSASEFNMIRQKLAGCSLQKT